MQILQVQRLMWSEGAIKMLIWSEIQRNGLRLIKTSFVINVVKEVILHQHVSEKVGVFEKVYLLLLIN